MQKLPDKPYPLEWPEGWQRTTYRETTSRYRATFVQSRDQVLRALRLLASRELRASPRAGSIVISSNLPTRLDGLPLAGGRVSGDPGIAIWWRTPDNAIKVIACDKYPKVEHNLRACALALDAMRALERSGASQIFERSAQSCTAGALPSSADRHVEGVMSVGVARTVMCFTPDEILKIEDVTQRFTALARVRHPDKPNGSHEKFVELQTARDRLLEVAL